MRKKSNHNTKPIQAAGKKGSWGCSDQLLINKTITQEEKMYRRNLFTIWLDYKKAFDSVPHDWMIEALKLAKMPKVLITEIDTLTRNWSTRLTLQTDNRTITTDFIEYLRGIFQGDGKKPYIICSIC